jgi:DNA-binding NarL/FixJ family response regulator
VNVNETMASNDVRCVVLADRHHGLMEGVRSLLETTFDAVVMVADELSLLEGASRMSAALAVVDLALTRGDGIGVIKRLRDRCPEMKMIVISVLEEASISTSAMAAGADGFVLKSAIATDLLMAVDAVLAGQSYVTSAATRPARDVTTSGATPIEIFTAGIGRGNGNGDNYDIGVTPMRSLPATNTNHCDREETRQCTIPTTRSCRKTWRH